MREKRPPAGRSDQNTIEPRTDRNELRSAQRGRPYAEGEAALSPMQRKALNGAEALPNSGSKPTGFNVQLDRVQNAFAPRDQRDLGVGVVQRKDDGSAKDGGVLTSVQRAALHTHLASRLGSAYTKYSNACQEVEGQIKAERAARLELMMTLLNVAAIFVAPGLGNAIGALVNNIPAGASEGVYRAAMAIQGQALSIATSIGEVGKAVAKPAVDAALASNEEGYLDALNQGFSMMIDRIVGYVAANIENRGAIPDAMLWVYVANWDPAIITQQSYEKDIMKNVRSFMKEVEPIGTPEAVEIGGPTNLGRGEEGTWHLYEEYGSGKYLRKAAVSAGMQESALRRSFADFQGPWSMKFVGSEIISGGLEESMYERGESDALRKEFSQFASQG